MTIENKKTKTCLKTRANSGIGKQAAVQLAQAGFHVILGAGNRKRGENALSEVKEKSILDAAKVMHQQIEHLDVLIHNAADFDITRKLPETSVDGIETIWATNHIGPIILTNALIDLIQKNKQGRIITIASQGLVMHPKLKVDLNDPGFKKRKYSDLRRIINQNLPK